MTRVALGMMVVLLLAACGERAISAALWADVRDRIQPDQTSGEIGSIFASVPLYDGRDGFTWSCADGRFTGVFTPNPGGDPRLLYGRFAPSVPPAPPASRPSDADLDLMRRLQQHWHAPVADIEQALRRLDELGQAAPTDSDRAHSQRLTATARTAVIWVSAGRPEPLPITFAQEAPGDLDVAWMTLAITGDARCLRHIVVAATTANRAVQFAARWSLEANILQDEHVDALVAGMTWSPAELYLVDRVRARCALLRAARPPTP